MQGSNLAVLALRMSLAVNSALIDRPLESRSPEGPSRGKQFDAALSEKLASRTTPVQRTQMSASTASAELRRAWTRVTGEVPDDKTVALITAQWAHETAHGASMYNYNFGGIKGVGPSGLSVEQRTKEGYGKHERQITDHFRAYESAEAGAEDYVKLLTRRFPEAVNAAKSGDTDGFVLGLKQRGYFTGDARAYQKSVTSISNDLLAHSFRAEGSLEQVRAPRESVNALPSNAHSPATYAALASAHSFDAALLRPLTPTILMNALSSDPPAELGSRGDDGNPSHYQVSTSSMVDEVLRASLQLAATEGNSSRRPKDMG